MLSQSWSQGPSLLSTRVNSNASLEGLKKGSRVGDGAANEVAAYILDHGGRAGVPATALVDLRCSAASSARGGVKRGALQEFVTSVGDAEEMSPSLFDVRDVHGIAILDMRIAQCDRHGGNVLVVKATGSGVGGVPSGGSVEDDDFGSAFPPSCSSSSPPSFGQLNKQRYRLVPIDNGYAFPSSMADLTFEWAWWPQASEPFTADDLRYVAALDAEEDLALLSRHGLPLRPKCADVVRTCTACLQVCAARGMTPADIAGVMCRDVAPPGTDDMASFKLGGMSVLEKLSRRAKQMSDASSSEAYVCTLRTLLEEYCDEVLS